MKVYLNYAALCPLRSEAEQETAATLQNFYQYLYSEAGIQWYEKMSHVCREKVAGLLSVPDPSAIAFVPNASTANHLVCGAFPWPTNAHILTSTHENPSILRALRTLSRFHGVHLHFVRVDSSKVLIREITHLMRRYPISAIVLSHVSHVDGRIFPIEEIAALARDDQILFVVDGAQAVGHIPVDLSHWWGDIYLFSGHKWCHGPLGAGALVMHDHFVELNPLFGVEHREAGQASAQAFEIGTHNIGLIAGLAKGCEMKAGELVRRGHSHERRDKVKSQLGQLSALHIQEWDGPHAPGILSFRCRSSGLHAALQAELTKRQMVVKTFPSDSQHEPPPIRLSWLEETPDADVERVIDTIISVVRV